MKNLSIVFSIVSILVFSYASHLAAGASECRHRRLVLYQPIIDGDAAEITRLIETGKGNFDINFRDCRGRTALHIATRQANPEIVSLILQEEPNLLIKNNDGELAIDSPLKWAKGNILSLLGPKYPAEVLADHFHMLSLVYAFVLTDNLPAIAEELSDGYFEQDDNMHGYSPLMLAAMTDNLQVAKLLLYFDADPNKRSSRREYTALHFAIRNNASVQLIQELLDSNADPKAEGDGKNSLMHLAVQFHQDTAVVEALLLAGAEVDAEDELGGTPLEYAVKNRETVRLLLLAGARKGRDDALENAAEIGNVEVGELLIRAGADVNSGSIYGASINYQLDFVNLLLRHGADPNFHYQDNANRPHPLHAIIRNPKKDSDTADSNVEVAIAEALIKAGASIDAINGEGETALMLAIRHRMPESMVPLLLKNGADPNLVDLKGYPSIMQLPYLDSPELHINKIKLLIKHGADINFVTHDGHGVLYPYLEGKYYLYRMFCFDLAAFLIESGAALIEKDFGYFGPIIWATENKSIPILRALVTRGASLDKKDWRGFTALHIVSKTNDTEITQLLVDGGADLEVKDRLKRTALGWAAFKGHASIVEILLRAGADKNTKDLLGKSPTDWAIESDNNVLKNLFGVLENV